MDKPKSERNLIADRIAQFVIENQMTTPYGGDVSLSKVGGRPHYALAFSQPRHLDGTVQVFSPNFIAVRYITGIRALPHEDSRVFLSEADAINFLRMAFVEREFEVALAIPTKPAKAVK